VVVWAECNYHNKSVSSGILIGLPLLRVRGVATLVAQDSEGNTRFLKRSMEHHMEGRHMFLADWDSAA